MRDRVLALLVRVALAGLIATPIVWGADHFADEHGTHYSRAAWPDDRAIDPGLAHAESSLVSSMARRDLITLLLSYTAPSRTEPMLRFLRGYAGHPTVTIRSAPADDDLGQQVIAVTCGSGDTQRVSLTWGWVDDAWRAFPDYALGSHDTVHAYPGCRSLIR